VQTVPSLCEFYPGNCLTTVEKARKNLSQGSQRGKCNYLTLRSRMHGALPPLFQGLHGLVLINADILPLGGGGILEEPEPRVNLREKRTPW